MKHARFPLMAVATLTMMLFVGSMHADALDTSNYYSHLSQGQIEDIFQLKTSDIAHPWTWAGDTQTFVVLERSDNQWVYWWNTPNIQMSAENSIYGAAVQSGFGNGIGISADKTGTFVKFNGVVHTAMQKYGFHLQTPTYVGERPMVIISIAGVLIPDGVGNGLGRLGKLVFKGQVVGAPTSNDLNTLLYVAPRDYTTSLTSFQSWVDQNWYSAIAQIKGNQILSSSVDQKTGLDNLGRLWTADNIISQNGLNKPNLSAQYICSQLQLICGSSYADVAKNIIIASGIYNAHQVQRSMPYDLDAMNAQDKALFHGVVDPRARMQGKLVGTGYTNYLPALFNRAVLNVSGELSEMSVALDNLSGFSFLEGLGFDPVKLWTSAIVKMILLVMYITFVLFLVGAVIKALRGKESQLLLAGRIIAFFMVTVLVTAMSINPSVTYNTVKNGSEKIFNLFNVTISSNRQLGALYGTGNEVERRQTELWLPYFNVWTKYMTNHTLLDSAQKIDVSSNKPEVKGVSLPKVDGVEQNKWSEIIADSMVNANNWSGDIYRAVDHFMAPRITVSPSQNGELTNGKSGVSLNVSQNENYNGDIQSSPDLESIPFQLLIFVAEIVKLMLFLEFAMNMALLLINLALSVTSKADIIRTLKELGASMLNICFMNIIVGIIVWTALMVNGLVSVVIFAMYVFVIFAGIKQLLRSDGPFVPKFVKLGRNLAYRVGGKL
jgi:hypothetical protein